LWDGPARGQETSAPDLGKKIEITLLLPNAGRSSFFDGREDVVFKLALV